MSSTTDPDASVLRTFILAEVVCCLGTRQRKLFADADRFDVRRDTGKSIAFGAGPHFCAGAAASRAMIADVALPSVFARLKGLRLNDAEPVRIGGWAFRGLQNLPVTWEA